MSESEQAAAERLLAEIRNGKHSLPGTLVQIDRYFEARGKSVNEAMRRIPGENRL